ncbi:uncharacterized protein LOC101449419 [Ceratitis capitata]|uniref:uncharacterized protein LOC101449419 n=1 Tax=Ceratitis capitata TaxID=7213 RepID=UPI000329A781|nr:uncharacterized protein LOC101449419 [Ceratitis capitata]
MLQIIYLLLATAGTSHFCFAAHEELANFWYTCDFHMEPDIEAMSKECRRIYSNKVSAKDVYALYKTEAESFYKFRNKLVACESKGKVCALSERPNGLEMPLLLGYNIDNRVRLYKNSEMNQCYLTTTNNVDFIKCIIAVRKKLLSDLNKNCSST